jgi:hypothetical protein
MHISHFIIIYSMLYNIGVNKLIMLHLIQTTSEQQNQSQLEKQAQNNSASLFYQLNQQRETMHSLFDLTYEQYQSWINDLKSNAINKCDQKRIQQLYTEALQCELCYSYEMWIDYCLYIFSQISFDDLQQASSSLQRLTSTCHCAMKSMQYARQQLGTNHIVLMTQQCIDLMTQYWISIAQHHSDVDSVIEQCAQGIKMMYDITIRFPCSKFDQLML